MEEEERGNAGGREERRWRRAETIIAGEEEIQNRT